MSCHFFLANRRKDVKIIEYDLSFEEVSILSNNETTAQLIARGLKDLLKKKDLDKIRIKEITDEVGLMRPTFYNYFQDKYEVVEYIFYHEVLEPIRPFLQNGLNREAFHFMVLAIQKDFDFYRREIMRSSQNSFREILTKSMHDFFLPILREKFKEPVHPLLTPENITEYYINIFLFVLTKWLLEGRDIPVDQIMEVYDLIVSRSLEDLLAM